MIEETDIDARLRSLTAATDGVGPRPGFSSRVMAQIRREAVSPLLGLGRSARRFLPLGVLMTAAALTWAISVNDQVDEAIATSDDTELVW